MLIFLVFLLPRSCILNSMHPPGSAARAPSNRIFLYFLLETHDYRAASLVLFSPSWRRLIYDVICGLLYSSLSLLKSSYGTLSISEELEIRVMEFWDSILMFERVSDFDGWFEGSSLLSIDWLVRFNIFCLWGTYIMHTYYVLVPSVPVYLALFVVCVRMKYNHE